MPISALGGVSRAVGSDTELARVRARFVAWLDDARGALSDNSVRALRSDLDVFVSWCLERGLSPLPASACTVAASP